MENKQQSTKEISMKNVNGSRGFVIHNFRNIGVYKESSTENGAFLRLSSLKSLGGLVCILGENNTGKSNLLAALVKLGKWDKLPSLDKDKPNFYGYKKDCLPKLEFSYRVPKQEMIIEKGKIFQGKIFNIIFTDSSKQKSMDINNLNEEQYKEFIQEKFDSSEVWTFCGLDPEGKEEIRLILPKHNRVLFCSVTHGGKSLQCFSTIDKDIEKVRNSNKEVLLSCQFKIEDKTKEYDDAKELRGFLKDIGANKIVQKSSTNIDYENYKFLIYLDEYGETRQSYYPNETFMNYCVKAAKNFCILKLCNKEYYQNMKN